MAIIPAKNCGYCIPKYCLTKLELIPTVTNLTDLPFGDRYGPTSWAVEYGLDFEVCIDDVKCTIPRNSWQEPPNGLYIPPFTIKPMPPGAIPLPGLPIPHLRLRHPRAPVASDPRGVPVCWKPTAGGTRGGGALGSTEPFEESEIGNLGGTIIDYTEEGFDDNMMCCKPLSPTHPFHQVEEFGVTTTNKTCCEAVKNKLCACLNSASPPAGLAVTVGSSLGSCCFQAGIIYPVVNLINKRFDSKDKAMEAAFDTAGLLAELNSANQKIHLTTLLRLSINDRLEKLLNLCQISGAIYGTADEDYGPENASRREFALECRCTSIEGTIRGAGRCPF